MIYYVEANAKRYGDGTKERPFRKISQAAAIACPGDEIIVGPGIYREDVNPQNAGTAEARIVYRAREKGTAVITGAESVKNWEKYDGDTWVARIPNGLFGSYNPYKDVISGDWYYSPDPYHTGEVYLNGKSMYEVHSVEAVKNPVCYKASWDPEGTFYKWYTTQDEETNETVIYANFRGADPNAENVEINVRKHCFYPTKTGVGYITVSGFVLKQAATQWAPPTAYQEGLIGPHWSKGWIIEDCEVSDSKCSGISLGKYLQPYNENKWVTGRVKHGTQTERDAICQAQLDGWSKETVGSHIVRRCDIHDCGQTGIVGHLGGVFSIIEDNHIHHINNKMDLAGAEIGGIKMHAAIDVIYRRNHIHHCTRGLWLDWQAQGTRVTQNLFHDNMPPAGTEVVSVLGVGEDVFIEVSHGPTLLDNNIFLSTYTGKLATQGVAYVHNLIGGTFTMVGEGTNNAGTDQVRYTPYHVPHRTEVVGFMTFLHGDMRFYNNIFVQPEIPEEYNTEMAKFGVALNGICGTQPYDEYPTHEEYFSRFFDPNDIGAKEDRMKYYSKMPVYTGGNVFFNGAKPCVKEQNFREEKEQKIWLDLQEENGAYRLKTNLYEFMPKFATPFISTEFLGEAFEPEQKFENPDGSEIIFNEDYFGEHRAINPMPGPFESAELLNEVLNER